MNQPTSERQFLVYRSSAGSGKTFTLVRIYLGLIFRQKDPSYYRQILAITFTNKAASEMKQRVLDYLEGFAAGEGHPRFNRNMMAALLEDTDLTAEQITLRSKEVLGHMLHNYSDLSISTIDQFVHRIIRSFAHELGLNPEFSIHMNANEAVETGVDYLLEKVGNDADITEKLSRFVDANVDNESSYNIRKSLTDFGKRAVFSEAGINSIERLKSFGSENTERTRTALLASISAFYKRIETVGRHGLEMLQSMGDESALVHNHIRKSFARMSASVIPGGIDTFSKLSESGTVLKQSALKSASPSAKATAERIAALCGEVLEIITKLSRENEYHERLLRELYNSATAAELRLSVDETNRAENRLSIADFNKIINRVVSGNPAPFIYERIGERYAHFLIDEFQDVSVLQWHNFLPLLENSLARGLTNLIVGDAKQSIYRWRNGDFRQFISIPAIPGSDENPQLALMEKTLERTVAPRHLDTNYRSGQNIVTFNNRLFSSLETNENPYLRKVFEETAQKTIHQPDPGYVRIDIEDRKAMPKQDDSNMSEGWDEWMKNRIDECLADGYRPGDIAVLFYKNETGSLAAEYLSNLGMAVHTAESLMLNKSASCQLLMNTLAWLTNRNDSVAALHTIENYLRVKGFSGDVHALWSKFIRHKQGKRQGIPNPEDFLKHMGVAVEKLTFNYTSVYEWAENAMRIFDIENSADAYTEALLNHLAGLAANGITQPEACVQWWSEEQENLSLASQENSEAIHILTIHKSKGLEFPVVLIPVLSKGKNEEYLWVNQEKLPHGLPAALLRSGEWMRGTTLESDYEEQKWLSEVDQMNVFYVAATRAISRLCVNVVVGDKQESMTGRFLVNALSTLFDNNNNLFEFGERKQRPRDIEQREVHDNGAQKGLPSWTWRDRIKLHLHTNELFGAENSRIKEGILLHALFAKLSGGQWRKALIEMKRIGDISFEQEQIARQKMEAIEQLPQVAHWLSSETVLAEREIILPEGTVLRPDCVVETQNEISVIDLKTGEKRPTHQKQVADYAAQLRAMQSAKKVRAFLLYTDDYTVLEVEPN